MARYNYIVNENGIIYRQSANGLKEVPKRMGARGYLEFKCNGKTISYKRFVADSLLPNPKGCDKVFSKDGDQWNTHPTNLRWVWTRERRTLTPEQALELTTDKHLIEFYTTGDKRALQRAINNVLEKMYAKMKSEYLGDLYIQIHSYIERNLLFNLKTDIIGTYIGLVRQSKRRKLKTIELDNKQY
jgi:hypothetical protein